MAKTTTPPLSQLAAEKANRGLLCQQEGKLEEAISFYRQAIAIEPNSSVHYNLGIAFHHQGNLPGAFTHYQEAIALNPDDIQVRYNLAFLLQQQGLLELAINNYQQVINLSSPKDLIKVKAYSNWGGILIGQGKFNEAIEIFEKAIALQPEDATLYNNLGQALLEAGNLEAGKIERAIATYNQALKLQPELIVVRHNLGKAYQKKGLHSEAIAYFQEVIERQPNNIFANSDCGYSFMEEGKLLEAMASFQKVIKNNPFVDGYCEKAKELTGEDQLEKAKIACALFLEAINISDFQKKLPVEQASCLLSKKPGFFEKPGFWGDYLGLTYHHLGNVSFEYGEYQQAEAYYKKALKIQPLNIEVYLALGTSLAKQKRVKAAITVCHWALAIQPDDSVIIGELETLLKTTNNSQEKANLKSAIGIINSSKLEDGQELLDRQDACPTLLTRENIECKGLNCEPCLQRIYKSFQPVHLGHNVYGFPQNNGLSNYQLEASIRTGKMPVLQESCVEILPNGRAWVVPQKNSWMICNAVAIINEDNQLLAEVSREYPGQLPGCQNYDINKHRIFSQEELPPLEKIDGTVAVLSGLSGNVYFHWMVDILPRLEILRDRGVNFEEIDWFLINSYQQEFQRETLRILGIPTEKILESDRHPYLQANKLIVPSYPGDLGWLPKWALEFHRREFLNVEQASCLFPKKPGFLEKPGFWGGFSHPGQTLGGDKTNSYPDTARYPERIYISRNQARYRRVLNEDEVISLLSKYDFVKVVPESMSWEEQIALFANAKAIVSPHGSGLTNIMFCQPGTTVIELFSPHYIRHYYWVISQQLGLEHYYLKGEGFPCYPIRELMYPNPLTEDILINLNYLEEMMMKTGIMEKDYTRPINFPKRTASGNKNMQSKVNPTEAAGHYNDRAQSFLKQKKFDEAKAACEQALKNQPDFAPACKTMGNILQTQGQSDAAWQWYSKAVEIQPDFAEAYTNMGTLYAQRQDWQEAIAYFQKAIALKPDLAPAHRNLARAYEKIGQIEAAAESRQQALSLEGQGEESSVKPERNPVSLRNRVSRDVDFSQKLEPQEAKSESNNNLSAMALPAEALLAYKQLGQMLQGQGKVEEAWQWYRKAIALSPNDPEIYLNLGILYAQQQQWHDAIKCYKKSLKLQPNFAEGYRKLATALTQVGQQQEAAEYWYRAYSIEPQKATAEEHLILGNTLLRQNLINQAISCYCRAIELNPNLKGAYENLGEALKRQGKQYQEQNRLGLGFQEEWGRQIIPQEILQKAEQLKQTASNLMMYDMPNMDNGSIIKPGQLSKANIVQEALKHFDRVFNELVNSVAFAFNLKHDVPLSYLESSLPIRSNNYLLSPTISYPEKPEFKIQYPPTNGQQPLVTVESNLSDTYWNVGGMKSDLELGMEPEMPPALKTEAQLEQRWQSPSSSQWQPLDSWASVKSVAPQPRPLATVGQEGTTINLAELHVQRAHAYFAKGVWEQAIAECERAIAMKPDLAAAYTVLGNACQQTGKLEEAESNYRQALALEPNDATVQANLGNLYAEEKKWQQAIPFYQKAIALKPNFAGAYRNLAKAWTQVGKSAEATDCWYQAYTLEPQNVTANQYFNLGNSLYRLGQLSQAVSCYRKAIELNANYAAAYHNLASALKRQGKLDESAFYYQKAQELNGGPLVSKKVEAKTNGQRQPAGFNGNSQVKANTGDVLTSSSETNRQDGYSTRSVKADAQNNESLLEKARRCLGQGQWDEAIAAGNLAIKIQPQAEAYLIMGQAWQGMDKAEEAIGCYQKAIEFNSDLRDAYQGWVWALQRVGKAEEAEELSYKALIQHPKWFTAEEFCALAKGYLAEGKTEKGVGCYRQAVKLNSQLWEAYFCLGQIFSSQQQWEEAVGYYRQAVELNNKSIGSYYGLGQALAEKGEWQEAIACYQKVIELDGQGGNSPEEKVDIWEVYNHLGDGLQELGQIEEAVEAYRRAIELAEN